MATLPPKSNFTDTAVTQGGFRAALDQLRDYLAGLLGEQGTAAQARATLGLGGLAVRDEAALWATWLTGSGNYIVPQGVYQLRVDVLGAGGGGAGGANFSEAPAGGGGAAGEWLRRWLSVQPGQVIPYECGLGGTPGARPNGAGGVGGNTIFGGVVARGGGAGVGSAPGQAPRTPGVIEALPGADGLTEFGGAYGEFGTPGRSGVAAGGYGAGGGGGTYSLSATSGAPGLIIVMPVVA